MRVNNGIYSTEQKERIRSTPMLGLFVAGQNFLTMV